MENESEIQRLRVLLLLSISAAVKGRVVSLQREAACVGGPCGHTAGFETSSWGIKGVKEAKESSSARGL